MEDTITITGGDTQYVCRCNPLPFKEANKLLFSLTKTFSGVIGGGPLSLNEDDLSAISDRLLKTLTVDLNGSQIPLDTQIDQVLRGNKRMANWAKLVKFALYHNLGDIDSFLEEVAGMLGTLTDQES
jgi:hypothetical protein